MTHNQQVPGSSPGGATTLEIKHLQRCRCFFSESIKEKQIPKNHLVAIKEIFNWNRQHSETNVIFWIVIHDRRVQTCSGKDSINQEKSWCQYQINERCFPNPIDFQNEI